MGKKILATEICLKLNGKVYYPCDDFELNVEPVAIENKAMPRDYIVMINNLVPAMPDDCLNEFAKLIVLEREKRGLE